MKSCQICFLIICLSLLSSSCSNSESKPVNKIEDSANNEKDRLEKEKQIKDSINLLLNKISVRIYNHTPLFFDSEGYCMTGADGFGKEKTFEVENFNKTREFKCEKGNYIQKLSIEGSFKGINIQFLNDKEKVMKELKDYNLDKIVTFSSINHSSVEGGGLHEELKDKFYQDWFEKVSKLKLFYQDSVFYTASWKSNGWYVQ
jgi:hypothetical protein